jgi:outer membrane protein assembly factor BamB
MPWYKSPLAVIGGSLLFPPAGLALLWTRRSPGVAAKLGLSLVIAGIGIVHLFAVYGLKMELDGTGSRPIFSFGTPESHQRRLERSRSESGAGKPETLPPSESAVAVPAADPAVVLASEALPAYWSDFRGPGRNGIYSQAPIVTDWPRNGLPKLWSQPVGGGYASFVVAGGLAFTIEQRRGQEVTAAYDLKTGKEQWTNSWSANFQESLGGDGPRATPVWHEGHLYTQGAEGELRALDAATGKTIWRKNILSENGASNVTWGVSNSPLAVDDKLITIPGGSGGRSVVAYNRLTGERIWSALDDKASYTSPMVVTLGGKRQLLIVSASRAMGLEVATGALLWDFPWTTDYDINSAQPIVTAPNRFFISAGYGHGAALVEVSESGGKWTARAVWENKRMKNKFNSSVLLDGYIYGLDEGILACINAETGEQKWKGGRYGYGQLVLAGKHLVIATERGEVVLVEARPDRHSELASFAAIDGKTWNYPAISDGLLLVRNTTEMACFRIGRQ